MFEGTCMSRYLDRVSLLLQLSIYEDEPDEENADTGIVLRVDKTQVIFQVIEAGLRECVAVKIVLLSLLVLDVGK